MKKYYSKSRILKYYSKSRIFLITLAFGLASVPFFNAVYEKWTYVSVYLPKVASNSTIYVVPSEIPFLTGKKFKVEKLIQDRDLSIYDFGNAFNNCGFILNSEQIKCEKQRTDAREFILNHWNDKKRAYIIYQWTGVDCSVDLHIFVEPDEQGVWKIIIRTYGDLRYASKIEEKRGHSIKYKLATDDNHPLKIGTSYLSVRDEKGKEVEGF